MNKLKTPLMPSIWLRVKVKVQPSMTGCSLWSYDIWLWHIPHDHGITYNSLPLWCYFLSFHLLPRLLTLYWATRTPPCTLNSPGILLQSHCTCFSLLEMFFPQASSRVISLSLPLNLYSKVTWIFYLKVNTHVTDTSNLPSFNYFSL